MNIYEINLSYIFLFLFCKNLFLQMVILESIMCGRVTFLFSL